MSLKKHTQVLVLGGGPGGYSAAFRAADLGLSVILVERYETLGGVCLNVGCIPSKALLHVASVINEAKEAQHIGLKYKQPEMNLDEIRKFKQDTVDKLTGGVKFMASARKVEVVRGTGKFVGSHEVEVANGQSVDRVQFEHCIVAAGSEPVKLPFLPDDPRIMDSTDALELEKIPKRLLIVGGGIIGLEMATIYQALGAEITIVEFADQLVPAADKDLVRVYQRYNKSRFKVLLKTKLTSVEPTEDALHAEYEDASGKVHAEQFDAILVAVGRTPNGLKIGAEAAGISVNERGFVSVDKQLRTNVAHIFAIGDICGEPMLAHKATHEGHVAAEVIAGHKVAFEPRVIPSIAYTDPEIAWTGFTEKEAKAQGLEVKTAVFPWSASGRAIGAGRSEGKTKLVYDKKTGTLLGAGIVGINAGELLGELSLAIEFGADVEDIALTIHAHPTLHETVGLAAELANGTITDLPNPSVKKK